MSWIYYIIIILIALIIIPVPIKLRFTFVDNNPNFYIYNLKINLHKNINKAKKIKKKSKAKKRIKFSVNDFKIILHRINCAKFKPTLRMKIISNFGILDASATAILCGVMHSLSPVVRNLLSVIFKIKNYDFSLQPEFNKDVVTAQINSIIFINLAKIINMFLLIRKTLKHIKNCHKQNEYSYS
jgi:hypothetical protein